MTDPATALDRLPSDARMRLDAFVKALDRVAIEDLPLYVARRRQPRHRRAVEEAALVARDTGLQPVIDAARVALCEGVIRAFTEKEFRVWAGGLQVPPDLGPVDQRVRILESLGHAVTALVLGDRLAADVQAELLGLWDRLIP